MQRKWAAAGYCATLLIFFLAGCSTGDSEPGPSVPREASLGGHVLFRVDGGFAGVRQTLSIDDSGLAVARDERRGTETRRRLDAARLAELRTAFANVDDRERPPARRPPGRCPDCLQFTLAATVDGERHDVRTHVPARSPAYREVMTLLSEILRDMLSPGEDFRK